MRVKRGKTVRRRHKRLLQRAKGYRSRNKNVYRLAKQTVTRAHVYAFRDRRVNKREQRALQIIRVNAAVRAEGLSYSKFISALKKKNIELDRKVLAQIAMLEPKLIAEIVKQVK